MWVNTKIICFLFTCFGCVALQAQPTMTAREVINKHINAIGGQARLDAIKSWTYNREEYMPYYKKTVTKVISYKSPGRWRTEFIENGKPTQTCIYKGEKGWVVSEGNPVEAAPFGMPFDYFLTGYLAYVSTPDFKIDYQGQDSESDNLLIQVTSLVNNPLKDYYKFFINPKTFLLTRVQAYNVGPLYSYYFKDYKTLEGVQVAMTTTQVNEEKGSSKDIARTGVQINIALADNLFADPTLKK
ncbi:MAG: hypothetical protein ABIW38_05730 [Ferruginibacter sp.]